MSFGTRLKSIRKAAKISRDELADKAGIHVIVLGRYERDESVPSIEVAVRLAASLDTSLEYLAGVVDVELDANIRESMYTIHSLPVDMREHVLFGLNAMIEHAFIVSESAAAKDLCPSE